MGYYRTGSGFSVTLNCEHYKCKVDTGGLACSRPFPVSPGPENGYTVGVANGPSKNSGLAKF